VADNGWIKLHRKIRNHWIYDCNPYDNYHAWEDILLSVESFPSKVRSGNKFIDLKPGQMITSLSKLTKKWGWNDRSKTRRFLALLEADQMIIQNRHNNETLLTVVNWELYQIDETKVTQTCNTDETKVKQPTILKENIRKEEIKKSIIEYLNEKTGKSFKATTKTTTSHINARLAEGFSIEDFKKVIDNRVKVWKNDPKMSEYLRPETLFGTKFESYLNSTSSPKPPTEKLGKYI